MNIIIAGAGEIGFHLAKLLSYESQSITLIDTNKERLKYASSHLDIRIIRGDSTAISILKDAHVESSDLVIAVTASETTNITISVLAKQLGCKRTIARVSNVEFIQHKDEVDFTKFGIDELISPETLAAEEINLLIGQSAFTENFEFEDGALNLVSLILPKHVNFINKTVKDAADLLQEIHFIPIAIQRYGTQYTIIPRGDTLFKENDTVVFITSAGGEEELCKLTGKSNIVIKNIMILGGSKIGCKAAKDLSAKGLNVKLIEQDRHHATDIADELTETLVIHGDGRDVELLKEEDIANMDAVVAVTGNSETNIMSCLVAKSQGVKKTIALVENMDYFEVSLSIGIDTLINKKLLAANSIVRHIRRADVVSLTKLNNVNVEVLEFKVKADSKITKKPIKDTNIPRSAIIGGVIRNGKGITALGDFKIIPNDRVVVCCLPNAIPAVEKLFL